MFCKKSLVGVRIGCIGCGSMGSAILSALLPYSHQEKGLTLSGYNRTPERITPLEAKGVHAVKTIAQLVQTSDILLLGIKPIGITSVLKEALSHLNPNHLIVSLATGVSQKTLSKTVEYFCPVVRVMPNTTALVGAGIFAICTDDPKLSVDQQQSVFDLFSYIGLPIILPECHFSAFTALIGCGSAYIFYFMDALVEAAVTLGFSRQQSIHMINELISGSAKLANLPGSHPALLREQICSPGGITIAAINHMDRMAIRGNLIDAIFAAYQKDKESHVAP